MPATSKSTVSGMSLRGINDAAIGQRNAAITMTSKVMSSVCSMALHRLVLLSIALVADAAPGMPSEWSLQCCRTVKRLFALWLHMREGRAVRIVSRHHRLRRDPEGRGVL